MSGTETVVVFDLDDTLSDWWSAIHAAAEAASDVSTAAHFREVVRREAWTRRGDGAVHRAHWRLRVEAVDFWRHLFPDAEAETVAERFLHHLRPRLYDDVVPALAHLAQIVDLGILTNSAHVDREIHTLAIAERFSTVVAAPEPIRKPHPEAFARLCAELRTEPGTIWYVGDSPIADVEPARACGMTAVWLDRFGDGWTPPDDVVHVRSLDALTGLPDLLRPER